MDRSQQQWVATVCGVPGLRILPSLDNEFVRWDCQTSISPTKDKVLLRHCLGWSWLRRIDDGNGLSKGRVTLFKSGGPSPGRSSTSSTWKRDPLGSKLHLESWVWSSLKDERVTISAAHTHSQSWEFGGVWESANMREKREVTFKELCRALIKLGQNFRC